MSSLFARTVVPPVSSHWGVPARTTHHSSKSLCQCGRLPPPGGLAISVTSWRSSAMMRLDQGGGLIHPAAPHYSTLLRVDPTDTTGTRIIGDLAESWTTSKDGLTYTFKIRRGVKFHDGSALTARDVKASYDKIINPPPGLTSPRK